ncbi:hypothetical protein ACFW5X_21110 [Streptomyces albogriseolus]|uniref:hypothetical protein n=1 Tax=Streptomyces TaxID=1883 RepID=UPI002A74F230|nr:hypothetical protein [Streptomyces sp. CL7]WPP28125.1 hypothetical protein SJH97_01835 [Streptomyces sp. CL7]
MTAKALISFDGADFSPLTNGEDIVALARAAGVRRVTVLKGDVEKSPLERSVEAGGLEWTLLSPVEFMSNALEWAGSVRFEGVVREAFPELAGDESVARWRREGYPDEDAAFFLTMRTDPPEAGCTVLPTVEKVTGRPARAFAQWVRENAAAFGG